jgi:hypothetical protein
VARAWFLEQGGVDIARHFAATTTNVAAAAQFGITTTFGFWDWVGGRYSLWSAIGLSLAIAIGADAFEDFLAGAHAMDEHFRTSPLAHNLPVQLALIDVWYRNFHGFTSRSVAPYHQGLKRLPAEQRVALELAYGAGHSLEEIASIMDCQVSTVKARMFHARVKLRLLLPTLAGQARGAADHAKETEDEAAN